MGSSLEVLTDFNSTIFPRNLSNLLQTLKYFHELRSFPRILHFLLGELTLKSSRNDSEFVNSRKKIIIPSNSLTFSSKFTSNDKDSFQIHQSSSNTRVVPSSISLFLINKNRQIILNCTNDAKIGTIIYFFLLSLYKSPPSMAKP